ncbi:MAG: VOC family protein [Alphaproteobacteria bacterium]|nr:VOC family protein [Alphaproteobacteria bacterium]
MTIQQLDHVNINTSDLEACKRFYADILGFEDGERPDFGFPGAWMYCGDQAVIHIMAMPDAPTGPTGPIDHVAFRCTGFEAMKDRLEGAGLSYKENVVPDFGIKQLFVHDPDGIKVELNFFED